MGERGILNPYLNIFIIKCLCEQGVKENFLACMLTHHTTIYVIYANILPFSRPT